MLFKLKLNMQRCNNCNEVIKNKRDSHCDEFDLCDDCRALFSIYTFAREFKLYGMFSLPDSFNEIIKQVKLEKSFIDVKLHNVNVIGFS